MINWKNNTVGCHVFSAFHIIALFAQNGGSLMNHVSMLKKTSLNSLEKKLEEQMLSLDLLDIQVWTLKDPESYGWANKAHADFLGVDKITLENKSIYELVTEDEAKLCVEGNRKVFETQEAVKTEERVKNAQGHERLLSIVKTPKLDENGSVEAILCKAYDITEVERTQKLSKANQLLQKEIKARKKAEKSLERRFEFEKKLSQISSRFINFLDIEEAINESLRDMGKLCKASRSYIFAFKENRKIMDNVFEWCAEGVSSQINDLKDIPTANYSWWMNKLENNKTIHIVDIANMPSEAQGEKEVLEGQGIKALLVFPFYIRRELAGYVGFDDVNETGEWNEEDLAILRVFSEILGNALERYQSEESLRESEAYYRTIFETTSAPTMVFEEDGTISMVNGRMEEIFGLSYEDIGDFRKWMKHIVKEDRRKVLKNRCLRIENPDLAPKDYSFRLIDKQGNERHVLITVDCIPGSKKIVSSLLDISDIKQAEERMEKSNAKLQKTLEDVVNSLGSVLEMVDLYTAGHQQRVAALACAIAEEMGLSEVQIQGIKVGSLLHDIGKIAIPPSILNKPGKLSYKEFSLIQDHPVTGYEIMKNIDLPWPVAEMILQHHERIDGSGYPEGIKGTEMLLEAKILFVADVVEAMSSHRPYRPALGIEKAIEEISQNKGTLYDLDVVDACLSVLAKDSGLLQA